MLGADGVTAGAGLLGAVAVGLGLVVSMISTEGHTESGSTADSVAEKDPHAAAFAPPDRPHGHPCRCAQRHDPDPVPVANDRPRATALASLDQVKPWGLERMRPYPAAAVLPTTRPVLDPHTQIPAGGCPDGAPLPVEARHKRSNSS
ncbi:putative ATP-grasp-modified RiPP [Streptomyces sp. NPDC020996]|uniref:putative ATP-grasp-modified RiPP n=1 Tax=Streptomyces sp. NPDC020996 TaxID=3154791 RepID=UPI0033D5FA12